MKSILQSGWNGGDSMCSQFSCEALNNCNGHGTCVSSNSCQCDSGWIGNLQCSQFSCYGANNCNGHGSCMSNNMCKCQSGWDGNSECSQITFTCNNLDDCSGKGNCVSSDMCQCYSGWKCNSKCSQFSCDGVNNCNGHGSCVPNNTCQCESGWKGNSMCSQFSCNALNNCNGHGLCVSNNTCSCNLKWHLKDCSFYECLMSLSNEQLSCSNNSQLVTTFDIVTSTTIGMKSLEMNSGTQKIIIPSGSLLNVDVTSSSAHFMSTSWTPSNNQFFTNISNLVLQNSISTLIDGKMSNPIEYNFNNLIIDSSLFSYGCFSYEMLSNLWTNESITTLLSSSTVSCSTNFITSVAVKRTVNTNTTPKSSGDSNLTTILVAVLVPSLFILCVLSLLIVIIANIVKKVMTKQPMVAKTPNFEL